MKLRHRIALTFAVASTASLVVSRVATIDAFRRVQEYELDEGLMRRARDESSEIAIVGRRALEAEYHDQGEANPLEQLVTYGALYRADGTVVADTPSFAHAPALSDLGVPVQPAVKPPSAPFDFHFRGSMLRGVLVEIKASPETEHLYLLVAASRRDMDADARQLIDVGWWVFAAMIPFAAAVGAGLGRRMTLGIESVAAEARRVTGGDPKVAPEGAVARDDEVAALQRALREMVDRLNRLLETERRFASHAAHELRSPLAALRGELELALRRPRSPEEYEQTLRVVLDDTNRLIALSEDLLVVARQGEGAGEHHEDVDVASLIDAALDSSRAAACRERIGVAISAAARGVAVRGARVALVRMVRNLLDNAVMHGDGAPVRVAADTTDDGQLTIVVEDDGPGIADVDRGRIFEHFHRGADAREDSGAGLGLGIAREVARQHAGDVALASPCNPTRFVVHLPLRV